jgi:Uma2 family endonuclease
MTTAIASPAREVEETDFPLADILAYANAGQYIAISDVSWEDYERLLEWRDKHRKGARLTYDRGVLQIMVVTNPHERLRKVLAMLVEAWLEETGGEFVPSGQLTHKRKDLRKGFEPDECYYIQNWKKVAGLRQIDFLKDPPPDLMVEVEYSRKVKGRLPIIAAFKIPEVWRYDGEQLIVLQLQPRKGRYAEVEQSRAIPGFPFHEAPRFLEMARGVEISYAEIGRQFRKWIRSQRSKK